MRPSDSTQVEIYKNIHGQRSYGPFPGLVPSKTAWSCHGALNALGETNNVTLMRIPGQSGFTGIARAYTWETSVKGDLHGPSDWSCDHHLGVVQRRALRLIAENAGDGPFQGIYEMSVQD